MNTYKRGTKFLREFIFADSRFSVFSGNYVVFAIRTDRFFSLAINFSFAESIQYPALIIFSLLLSTCNRNRFFKQYYDMRTLCKTSNSLQTVLFLNERGKL